MSRQNAISMATFPRHKYENVPHELQYRKPKSLFTYNAPFWSPYLCAGYLGVPFAIGFSIYALICMAAQTGTMHISLTNLLIANGLFLGLGVLGLMAVTYMAVKHVKDIYAVRRYHIQHDGTATSVAKYILFDDYRKSVISGFNTAMDFRILLIITVSSLAAFWSVCVVAFGTSDAQGNKIEYFNTTGLSVTELQSLRATTFTNPLVINPVTLQLNNALTYIIVGALILFCAFGLDNVFKTIGRIETTNGRQDLAQRRNDSEVMSAADIKYSNTATARV